MLTPIEELGLSGSNLAGRVRRALHKVPEPELLGLLQRIECEAGRRHLVYLRDGKTEVIRAMACPLTILPHQQAYIHFVSLTIQNALKRLPEIYFQDAAVREILRITPEEEEWLSSCWGPSHRDSNPIFGRLDAVVDFTSPMWKDSLRFVEPNLSGIGGLHLTPTCEQILADVVLPALREQDAGLRLEIGQDIRELLMHEVRDHLESLGRPIRHICFVEPKYAGSGPDEQEAVARYYHDHHGLKVMHADPAELTLRDGEVYYEGNAIDLAYRDYAVSDLNDLRRAGVDIEPMRTLFRRNHVISSIAAELDQKSLWEVLTDPVIAQKLFSADERRVFRRHILWTRLVSDRATLLPDGQMGGLLDFVRRERESLVLKPNRSYGGQDVLIGPLLTDAEWGAAVDRALADAERWVVQQLASIPVSLFPIAGPDGSVNGEPFHVVMGFAPSQYGVAIVGRASQRQVVNIAQRGGMCAVMVGQPPARLHGPGTLTSPGQPQ
jgi:hypothetical protein